MMADTLPPADVVFVAGPEVEVAQAAAVCAGRVADYAKQVLKRTDPPTALEIEWIASARLVDIECFKGAAPTQPIRVRRHERSFAAVPDPSTPYWEAEYGTLEPGGKAVVFLGAGPDPPVLRVVPSGDGERDFADLVKNVARIQAIADTEQRLRAWADYLTRGATVEGRKAALRGMIQAGVDWPRLRAALAGFLASPRTEGQTRAYVFALLAYQLGRDAFALYAPQVVDFQCEIFLREPAGNVLLQYLSGFSHVLDFASQPERPQPLRDAVTTKVKACLRRRPSVTTHGEVVSSELARAYEQQWAELVSGTEGH
jgi:hypothetical protein